MIRRVAIRPQSAHCVCQPGSVAHEVHARPGARAGAHLNPACPHSTLANDCVGYEALRLRLEAARARKDEQLVAARDAQARAMVTGDYPTASQLRPLRLTQATAIDKLTADPGAWRSCRDRHDARGGAAPGELRRAVYTALAGHSGAP